MERKEEIIIVFYSITTSKPDKFHNTFVINNFIRRKTKNRHKLYIGYKYIFKTETLFLLKMPYGSF